MLYKKTEKINITIPILYYFRFILLLEKIGLGNEKKEIWI